VLLALLTSQWWQGTIAGILIAGALWIAHAWGRGDASFAAVQSAALPPSVAPQTELAALVQAVVPAWNNNVQLARSQTQEAIDQLTQRFVGIHERIGGALSMAEGGRNGDVPQVIQSSAVQLGNISAALEQVVSTRGILLHKIELLAQYNDEIHQLAQQLQRLAGAADTVELSSLELNGAELAAQVVEVGQQIQDKTATAQLQIQMALVSANQLDGEADGIVDDSRQVIDTVIADFRRSALKLSGTVDQLEEDNREVDQEVCDILINLQFQDRISQILDHVQRDMSKLVSVLEQAGTLPLPPAWLNALEQTYTTLEQRQTHAGERPDKSTQSQVDFF